MRRELPNNHEGQRSNAKRMVMDRVVRMNDDLKHNLEKPYLKEEGDEKRMVSYDVKNYDVKKRELFHGFCPPGYERVKSYDKGNSTHVKEHCRKIRVSGRGRALATGLYNEGMIAQEDIRLGVDTTLDLTKAGAKNATKIERRSTKVRDVMQDQENKKEEVRGSEQ